MDQLALLDVHTDSWMPHNAKLFCHGSTEFQTPAGWLGPQWNGQWFQVDLYILHEVHGVITQGAGFADYTIYTLSIALSNDTSTWNTIKNTISGSDEVTGNTFILFGTAS